MPKNKENRAEIVTTFNFATGVIDITTNKTNLSINFEDFDAVLKSLLRIKKLYIREWIKNDQNHSRT